MTQEDRRYLRKIYPKIGDKIRRYSPYDIYDWALVFTPIESNVWHDIRKLGLPFYPQYPVRQYFLDFADPVFKIGIEVDGNAYHSSADAKKRDYERQKEIEGLGWMIIRFTTNQTFWDYDNLLLPFYEGDYGDYDKNEEEYLESLEKYHQGSYYILSELRDKYYKLYEKY